MIDIEEILSKYEKSILKQINKENVNKIINFLIIQGCDYADELLENYLDLFIFSYEEFIDKFNKLNLKYNHNFLNLVSENMDLLEEFYEI